MEKGPGKAIKPFKSDFNTERITEILIVLSDFIKYLLPVTSMFLSLGKNLDWQLDLYGNHSRAKDYSELRSRYDLQHMKQRCG